MTPRRSSRSSRKLTRTCPASDRPRSAIPRPEHGTILYVPVVIIIAILAVAAVAAFTAVGRGGQLSVERTDYAPLDLGPVSATDVVLLRPPTALWGYDVQATDEAMERIAESVRERDVRIVALEQLVTDLSREHAPPPPPPLSSPYVGTRRRRLPEEGGPAGEGLGAPGATGATSAQTGPPERSHD